jgi:hypothetical protein
MASIHRVHSQISNLVSVGSYVGLKRRPTHWPTQHFNPYAC